jgi:hydrogenase maturation factor HypF (carbamoyltransferase family)
MLLEGVAERLLGASVTVWTNRAVPANDGGVSLGQAALAVVT